MARVVSGPVIALAFAVGLSFGQTSVMTDAGRIEGITSDVFLGIPYATAARWKSPQPVRHWSGVRPATALGVACPQSDPSWMNLKTSEDCLSLNVWSRQGAKKQPVMVWIHGGSNIAGTGSLPSFGAKLASRKITYVSVNYRLGALGFLAHPELSAESPHHASGNYALLDLIAALRWVHRNIEAFGGDPANVTVFGESAGGVMICFLMASPLAHGLFHKAILESCTCQAYVSPELKRPVRYEFGRGSAEEAGASLGTLKELRAMPAEEIVKKSEKSILGFLYAGGTIDGWVLQEQPAATFASGRQAKVPVLTGSNADEGTVTLNGGMTLARYKAWLADQFDIHAKEVFEAYPASNDADAKTAYLAVTADYQRAQAVRSLAKQSAKAYLYYFTYPPKGAYATEGLGSFHGLELAFIAGGYFRPERWGAPDASDLSMVDIMTGYWTRFAKTGDPNRPGLPQWDPGAAKALELGIQIRMIPAPHIDRSQVFERILAARLATMGVAHVNHASPPR